MRNRDISSLTDAEYINFLKEGFDYSVGGETSSSGFYFSEFPKNWDDEHYSDVQIAFIESLCYKYNLMYSRKKLDTSDRSWEIINLYGSLDSIIIAIMEYQDNFDLKDRIISPGHSFIGNSCELINGNFIQRAFESLTSY